MFKGKFRYFSTWAVFPRVSRMIVLGAVSGGSSQDDDNLTEPAIVRQLKALV